ncbi:MAG: hypothetical protein AAGA78_08810, partial [Pseudomonadota bacterium]
YNLLLPVGFGHGLSLGLLRSPDAWALAINEGLFGEAGALLPSGAAHPHSRHLGRLNTYAEGGFLLAESQGSAVPQQI